MTDAAAPLMAAPTRLELSSCDREPIHIPGSIQPHGALLAFAPATGMVLTGSRNLKRWFAVGSLPPQGRSLPDLIGKHAASVLERALTENTGAALRHRILELPACPEDGQPETLEAVLHVHRGVCIAEFAVPPPRKDDGRWMRGLVDTIDRLRGASSLEDLVERTVRRVRQLTGFDRAMVYRFDDDWHGHVIADAHEPGMPSFFDLHYPASDIPAQARELFLRNLVRNIADVGAVPVPLATSNFAVDEPLDMTHAMLRSSSPIHIRYLKNMGVAASLTLSILVDGRLWGLVACHHRTPRPVSMCLHQVCHALAINLGFMVGWSLQKQKTAAISEAVEMQGRIIEAFNDVQSPLSDVIETCSAALLRMLTATGGVFWKGNQVYPFGQWPLFTASDPLLAEVRRTLANAAHDAVFVECAGIDATLTAQSDTAVSGFAAIRLEPNASTGIAWCRPEHASTVVWGGNPDKAASITIDAKGASSCTPRASFERWCTLVKGRARPWSDQDREAAKSLLSLRPVLAVRDSLAQVSSSERNFRSLLTLQSDAYWQTDLDGRLLALSKPLPNGRVLRGGESLLDLLTDAGDASTLAPLDRALREKRPFRSLHLRSSGIGGRSRFEVQLNGEPLRDSHGRACGWHGTITDVTREVELADRLRQAQRLESIGKLTGGVAHDFNNLLTVILGNSELLVEQLELRPSLKLLAEMILSAATSGAELTHRLLAFAREQTLDPRPVNVGALLSGMKPLLRRTLTEAISITKHVGDGVPPALADTAQLESAILNLCLNARDAMPEGGAITLGISLEVVEESGACGLEDAVPGDYVCIAVADTGTGISPENIRRVFEPFFTTKEFGSGTGLGLSIVYGFMRQSQGYVTIESKPGSGTTVRLFLPAAEVQVPMEPKPVSHSASTLAELPRGSETILLVEDEPLLRVSAERILSGLGYHVLVAQNASVALDLLGAHPEIALLFTDLVMPGGVNGAELAARALTLQPGLLVLYTSGYANHEIHLRAEANGRANFLGKPYRKLALAQQVRATLDSERSPRHDYSREPAASPADH